MFTLPVQPGEPSWSRRQCWTRRASGRSGGSSSAHPGPGAGAVLVPRSWWCTAGWSRRSTARTTRAGPDRFQSHGPDVAQASGQVVPEENREQWAVWPDWAIYWTLGNFLKLLATINLSKSSTFLGNFWKAVKIYHFSSEIILRQLLQTFGNFFLVTLHRVNVTNKI